MSKRLSLRPLFLARLSSNVAVMIGPDTDLGLIASRRVNRDLPKTAFLEIAERDRFSMLRDMDLGLLARFDG